MDQHRQIRFLIPPFFLFASVMWGWLLSGLELEVLLKADSVPHALLTAAAAGAATLPLGFLISIISAGVLRGFSVKARGQTYEAGVSNDALARMWAAMNMPGDIDADERLYVVATFDHGLLSSGAPGIHKWLGRRWNTFNTSVNCIVALLVAHLAGLVVGVPLGWKWALSTAILILAFLWGAVSSWRQAMAMNEFQSRLPVRQ